MERLGQRNMVTRCMSSRSTDPTLHQPSRPSPRTREPMSAPPRPSRSQRPRHLPMAQEWRCDRTALGEFEEALPLGGNTKSAKTPKTQSTYLDAFSSTYEMAFGLRSKQVRMSVASAPRRSSAAAKLRPSGD